jgi:DNA repair exonuclease SbcCD ATPase subunit
VVLTHVELLEMTVEQGHQWIGCRVVQRKLAVSGVALCLALGACGGDGEDDFKDDYRPLNEQVGKLDRDLRNALNRVRSRSDLQLEKQFGQFAQRTGDLQQEVDELEPPDDAKEELEDLTEALGDVQNALEDLERAADRGDLSTARSAAVQLVTSISRMQRARRELARAADI